MPVCCSCREKIPSLLMLQAPLPLSTHILLLLPTHLFYFILLLLLLYPLPPPASAPKSYSSLSFALPLVVACNKHHRDCIISSLSRHYIVFVYLFTFFSPFFQRSIDCLVCLIYYNFLWCFYFQERVQAKDPPSHYLTKLRTYLDPKASRSHRVRFKFYRFLSSI